MSKIILVLFSVLTIGSLIMTYRGSGLQGLKTHSNIKHIRYGSAGAWSSSGGGFSSGK